MSATSELSTHVPTAPVVAVAAVVFTADQRVLLIKRKTAPGRGLWSLPGGKLQAFEPIAAGVAREVHEETGIAVEVGPIITVIERMQRPATAQAQAMASDTMPYHFVIIDCLAKLCGVATAPVANDDASHAKFVALADVPTLATTDGLRDVIDLAKQRAAELGWQP